MQQIPAQILNAAPAGWALTLLAERIIGQTCIKVTCLTHLPAVPATVLGREYSDAEDMKCLQTRSR
jgi:hypothetical protein